MRLLLLAILCFCLAGCATIENFCDGPVVYGGTRNIWCRPRDMEGQVFAMADSPFSFALDTALSPVTALFELIRWLSGWPPSPEY